jgi:endonuclease/exonuclease/phosphatase family metal-dependent hydrolase
VTFRLLTYNIQRGGRARVEMIAHVINASRPDVVVLQEATDQAVVQQLAASTGMAGWGSFRRQSLGFLSREPLAHVSWHRPFVSRHAFIEVVPAGERLRIFGVHLSAVHAAWTEQRRVFELRALLRSVAQHQDGFHVLAGDFNTLAPGELLQAGRLPFRLRPLVWSTGGRIGWRTIQTVLDAGYADAYRTKHPDRPGLTMPTWDPHVRLDYVFVPRRFADRVLSCEVIDHEEARDASDHFPVAADLQVH